MDDSLKTASIWQATLETLKNDPRITPPMMGFLELAEAKGIIGETLYLEVPNDLARSMLDQRVRSYIEESLLLLSLIHI